MRFEAEGGKRIGEYVCTGNKYTCGRKAKQHVLNHSIARQPSASLCRISNVVDRVHVAYLQVTPDVSRVSRGEGGRRGQDRNEDDEEGGSEEAIHLGSTEMR